MSDADILAVVTIGLCLIGSMFFSGSETAITSLGEHQARKILEEGGREAEIVRSWVDEPVRVLSTILVGNNLTNTLMGSVATALAIRHASGAGSWAVPVAVICTTAVLLVFGEIVPKAFGRVYSSRLALSALWALNALGRVLAPITWLLSRLTEMMLSRAATSADVTRVTSDDLDYLIRVGAREGSIPADQAELLRGVVRFEDKIVRDIMVSQDRVTAIDLEWDLERIIRVARESGHSRMPVYEGDLDRIIGTLHIKSLVGARMDRPDAIRRLMRRPMFVSESLLISDLLQRFKEERVHLAVVVDDGGHTVGVVTMEDVLEQIVGKIFDESDQAPRVLADALGVRYMDGTSSLRDVEEAFAVDFEEFDGVDSIGDLLTQLAGQIPIAGSVIVAEGLRFRVLAANDRRVIRVSIEQIDTETSSDE